MHRSLENLLIPFHMNRFGGGTLPPTGAVVAVSAGFNSAVSLIQSRNLVRTADCRLKFTSRHR